MRRIIMLAASLLASAAALGLTVAAVGAAPASASATVQPNPIVIVDR